MSPFKIVDTFLSREVNNLLSLVLTILTIAIIFCAAMIWQGGEEASPRMKKWMIGIGAAAAIALLAKVIIAWLKAGLV